MYHFLFHNDVLTVSPFMHLQKTLFRFSNTFWIFFSMVLNLFTIYLSQSEKEKTKLLRIYFKGKQFDFK